MRRNIIFALTVLFGLSFIPAATANSTPALPSASPTWTPDTSPAQAQANLDSRVPLKDIPAPILRADARPYGGERVGIEIPPAGSNNNSFCTAAYMSLSSTNGKYLITAGHCGRDLSDMATGRFFYPCAAVGCAQPVGGPNVGNTGVRWNFDSTSGVGDFAAIRANLSTGSWVRKLRQPANGRIDTMTSAGDPVLGQNVSAYAGNSQKVFKGFYSFVDQTVNYPDGTVATNMAIVQAPLSGGCAVGGDSGSPIAASLTFNGVLSASSTDSTHCFLFVTQAATAMTIYGLHSAPAS